eukprot:TRINITY_DN29856_c0_g1_i1.p1 TRINITY_DN29856_c0_g1~~TRINITY_DN29856_c0_g1_i1.p1  ORF type:complete len:588 (-),score=72.85 TRINITY_DN29856_c0_g1_i1:83-1846(-)
MRQQRVDSVRSWLRLHPDVATLACVGFLACSVVSTPLASGMTESNHEERKRSGLKLPSRTSGASTGDGSNGFIGDGFARLLTWMQRGIDAHVPLTALSEVPRVADVLDFRVVADERVVVAKRQVKAGELLLRLPMQVLMHAGYYKVPGSQSPPPPSEIIGTVDGPGVASTLSPAMHLGLSDGREFTTYVAPQTWLALYMMEHRRLGSSSEWSPYLELLPQKFPTNPVFFEPQDWKWLEGSTFVRRALRHKDSLRKQFETVSDLVPGFDTNYTLDEFVWARVAISSRVFGWSLPGLSADDTDFMVPLGDMFNHRSPKQIEWVFNKTLRTLDYWAKEDVPRGEELLISYGGKCNSQYLLHYGFAMPGIDKRQPPLSTVRIPFDLDDTIPDRDAREMWLAKNQLKTDVEEFEVSTTAAGSGFQNMLGYARLLVIPFADNFDRTLKARGCRVFAMPPRCEQPLSLDVEQAALKLCISVVRRALAAYPTTLEEDEVLLNSTSADHPGNDSSPRLPSGIPRFLVLLRRDEKVVLRWWIRFFEVALEVTELPLEDIEPRSVQEFGQFSPESRYLEITLAALMQVERAATKALEL